GLQVQAEPEPAGGGRLLLGRDLDQAEAERVVVRVEVAQGHVAGRLVEVVPVVGVHEARHLDRRRLGRPARLSGGGGLRRGGGGGGRRRRGVGGGRGRRGGSGRRLRRGSGRGLRGGRGSRLRGGTGEGVGPACGAGAQCGEGGEDGQERR